MAFPALTNLVSYWRLDESSGNAADSYGSNTLTNNNTTAYASGKINNGADLEQSSSNSLSVVDNASLSITGDLSISVWFKPESQPALDGTHVIVSKWKATGSHKSFSLTYRDNSGEKRLGMKISSNGSTEELADVVQTLNNATWYHIVAVYTAATHRLDLYVNGASVLGTTSGFSSTSIFDSTASFFVGYEDGAGGLATAYLDGIIDELSIWSRILSSGDVTSLYNSGNGVSLPIFITISENMGVPTESISTLVTVPITVSESLGTPTEALSFKYGFGNQTKSSSTWANRSES